MRRLTIKNTLISAILAVSMFAMVGCNTDYDVEFDYNSSDYISELGVYTGVEYEPADNTVTELDVLEYIEEERAAYTEWTVFDDRRVAEGDKVVVNAFAYLDGAQVSEFSQEDVQIIVGAGKLYSDFPELENKLIGLIPGGMGSASKFEFTIPADFEDKEYAGKTLSFTMSVAEAYEGILPSFTDSFVSNVSNGEYTTVEDYKKAVRRVLQESADEKAYADNFASIMETIVANTKFSSYPQDELKEKIDNFNETMGVYATLLDMTAEEYCKETFGMTIEEYATKNIAMQLVLQEIAKREKITVNHSYYKKNLDRIAEEAGYTTGKELVDKYGKDYVVKVMLMEKVENFIYEKAVAKTK
ncbi:MAG: hypothetical protein IKL73_04865 [Lachnospiraceae bacterium]|nr:hypothetical protein [Lachnospiraceae bacterium]